MADIDNIMRLGIEAARAGDKNEARNMFRLLTREQPDNPQGWLWLAGVAEDREEKRGALERVLALDPTNDLARKGLQALGVATASAPPAPPPASAPAPTPPPARGSETLRLPESDFDFDFPTNPQPFDTQPFMIPDQPTSSSAPAADRSRQAAADEDFASSLDSINSLDSFSGRSTSKQDNYAIPDFGDEDDQIDMQSYMNRPRVRPEDIEIETPPPPPPKRKSGFLPLVLVVVVVLIGGALVYALLARPDKDNGIATNNRTPKAGTQQTSTRETGDEPTPDGGGEVEPTPDGGGEVEPTPDSGGEVEPTPDSGGGEVEPTPDGGGEVEVEPTVQPSPQPAGSLANANPSQVTPGTPLEANGWFYNFVTPAFAVLFDGPLGDQQPQGRWLHVLMVLNNNTGQPQKLPEDFFVLKDAQGRTYQPNGAASAAFTRPGENADFSFVDELPAGYDVSVALIFDVNPDATDLVLFSPYKTDEGYLVLTSAR